MNRFEEMTVAEQQEINGGGVDWRKVVDGVLLILQGLQGGNDIRPMM